MTTVIENELRNEVEAEMALQAVTIDCCTICGRTHYLSEMSECGVCGHFCAKCDCRCPLPAEDIAEWNATAHNPTVAPR
jgi:hypothetical protein